MIDFNNIEEIKKLDPKDVYGSTRLFAAQCEQIWKEGKISFPEQYKDIENIILCGMGGSAYGGYIVQSLAKEQLRIPLISNNDYHLPGFATRKSLIFLSSYSGSTEEVLSCGLEAQEKGFLITGMASGGKLAELLQSNNVPHLIFNPSNNPSGQPRLGTGYMVLGFIALLQSMGILEITDNDVMSAISEVKNNQEKIKLAAQDTAKKLVGYIPVIFSSEFLNGNAHILRNQLNETAKVFSAYEDVPELNHHLMEGLKNPSEKKLAVIFLLSQLYSPIMQKRMALTQDVVGKNGSIVVPYSIEGSTKISQVLNTLSFGGYLSLCLALLYGQDPSVIPWVDYFKEQLAK